MSEATRIADLAGAEPDHGGNVGAARRLFPAAPLPWIDLSTGISPHSYPLPPLPGSVFARLPEPQALQGLVEIAASAYGAPSAGHVVAAPGTQILLPLVAGLMPPGAAAVLAPTYAEHARAAALAGHACAETEDFAALADADLAIVVNPNNPDGRIVERGALLALAARLVARGGLLVVDEAFMDVMPGTASLSGDVDRGGIVVLRSFGKFHGLAGLRLGFALAAPALARRLRQRLGPWAVSGPAIAIGRAALADARWRAENLARLADAARRLDDLLAAHGLVVVGGTALFRLARMPPAAGLFDALGQAGILVRRFAGRPGLLRFGLPGEATAWDRLADAFARWQSAVGSRRSGYGGW